MKWMLMVLILLVTAVAVFVPVRPTLKEKWRKTQRERKSEINDWIDKNANKGCGNCGRCLKSVKENGFPATTTRMIVCPSCHNKRCPKATDHDLDCTNSNEPGQPGSRY